MEGIVAIGVIGIILIFVLAVISYSREVTTSEPPLSLEQQHMMLMDRQRAEKTLAWARGASERLAIIKGHTDTDRGLREISESASIISSLTDVGDPGVFRKNLTIGQLDRICMVLQKDRSRIGALVAAELAVERAIADCIKRNGGSGMIADANSLTESTNLLADSAVEAGLNAEAQLEAVKMRYHLYKIYYDGDDYASRYTLHRVWDVYQEIAAWVAGGSKPKVRGWRDSPPEPGAGGGLDSDDTESGRRQEAVPISEEAIRQRRELAKLNRDAHLPDLAASLHNRAIRLAEAGRLDEAVPISEEAIRQRRELAKLNRDAHLPDLAASLNNHALWLAKAERWDEVAPNCEEAVRLYRESAELNRDAHLPDLAASLINYSSLLHNLVVRLAEAGRWDEVASISEKAVHLYRELTDLNRDAHLPNLAASLIDHASLLPNLAALLLDHAIRLAEAGRLDEAVPIREAAVHLYRELTDLNRDTYLPKLATSLMNHSARLAEAGRPDEAVPISEEAVRLHRELANLNRDAHLPNLAVSLMNHAIRLAEAGRPDDGLRISKEAVRLRQEQGDNRDT